MHSLSPRTLMYTWLTAGLLLTAAAVWSIFGYFGAQLHAQAKAIEDAITTQERNRRDSQNTSTLQRQIADIQSNASRLDKAFPLRAEALDLVEYLEQLAEKHALEEDFTPVEPTRNPTLRANAYAVEELNFNLVVSGVAGNVLAFLQELEQQPRYLIVTKFSLLREDAQNATLTLTGTIPWH